MFLGAAFITLAAGCLTVLRNCRSG